MCETYSIIAKIYFVTSNLERPDFVRGTQVNVTSRDAMNIQVSQISILNIR